MSCDATILSILEKFGSEYAEAYAFAIAYTEDTPEDLQYKMIGVISAMAQSNYKLADDLISEAICLCYRNAIIAVWQDINKSVSAIKKQFRSLPETACSKINEVGKKKRALAKGNASWIDFKCVFYDCKCLYDELLSEFDVDAERANFIQDNARTECIYWLLSILTTVIIGIMIPAYYLEIAKMFCFDFLL